MGESGTEESGWTKANLQKLLAAMKTSIPQNDRKQTYIRGLKTMDWNMVAFPPFSPEACKEKWGQILQKMVKTRTLTELLVEAEGVISNPVTNFMIHPERPKRPAPPNAIFLEENRAKYLKQHPNMSRQKVFKNLVKKYQMLPDEDKAQYVEKFQLANEEYLQRMQVFSIQYKTNPKVKVYRKRRSANAKAVRDRLPILKKVTKDKETEGLPPQPPSSGYSLYCKEQRSSKKGLEGNNCVAMWAQGWRDMTKNQRNAFNRHSAELKKQYNVALNKYLMDFDEEKQQQILKESGVKRPKESTGIKRKNKIPGEPKMPSLSASRIFCKKQTLLLRKKIPNSRDRSAVVNKLWQDLTKVQKKCYKREVFENNRKYSMELQKWFETLPPAEQQLYRTHNPSKIQYLDVSQMEVYEVQEPRGSVYRPSDSEDEDTTDSSEEEENNVECDEVEEEEEDSDIIIFEVC